ncbi:hypothetical protein QE369_003466 [Agrobacterium larrymoorei]|uniref:Uncharacterized protein n=1 Tax=Agrobacterium larrymoorei TaxID=160699 RepID=A0AAJ2ESU2_9HYPH|nr:hypothetical protein [Agrobacterium larrymoorei]MDR6103269.1 hypothetical protein [Agrobacterium larrymoorei]
MDTVEPDENLSLIRLFESAELAAFLRGTSRYFLETLPEIGRTDADVREMGETLRDWGREVSGADEGAIHAHFADAFEVYLLEGEAPSVALRTVFEHFTEWLLHVYGALRGLDLSLSPDIRDVLLRMLATHAAIEEARDDMSAGMLFKGGKTARLSADEHRRLRRLHEEADDEAHQKLRRQVMKPIFLARQDWYRKERETVKEISTRTLQAVPIYQAIQALRFGMDFEGKPLGRIKLDRAVLEREFGLKPPSSATDASEDDLDHANAFAGRDGIHPDIAAGMYGFDSGRAFLQALVRARPIELAIELLTERTMIERHGDLLLDGQLGEEALKALHGDKRRAFLLAELNALSKLSGGEATTHQEVEGNVHRLFSALKVSSATDSDRHLAAERKTAGEAASAFAKDDLREAMEAKRRQLMACHFYMAASAKADELEALIDHMATLDATDDEWAMDAEAENRRAVRALAAGFGLASKPARFDMDGWLEQMKEDDLVL